MLGKKMEKALNEQLNNELTAAYVYLGMSAYCEDQNLPGFAHWLLMQSKEEVGHGMRFYKSILDRGGTITLKSIEAPSSRYANLVEVFEKALEHEQAVTRAIYSLYRLAESEEDYASHTLLENFAEEQVEEEKNALTILETLRRVGKDGTGLLILDRELGGRLAEEPK